MHLFLLTSVRPTEDFENFRKEKIETTSAKQLLLGPVVQSPISANPGLTP